MAVAWRWRPGYSSGALKFNSSSRLNTVSNPANGSGSVRITAASSDRWPMASKLQGCTTSALITSPPGIWITRMVQGVPGGMVSGRIQLRSTAFWMASA